MRRFVVAIAMSAGCGAKPIPDPAPPAPPATPATTLVPDAAIAEPIKNGLPPAYDWAVSSPQLDELERLFRRLAPSLRLFEFDQRGRVVSIGGDASTEADITRLATELSTHPMFINVTPVSGERQPDGTWRFVIRVEASRADPALRTSMRRTRPAKPP